MFFVCWSFFSSLFLTMALSSFCSTYEFEFPVEVSPICCKLWYLFFYTYLTGIETSSSDKSFSAFRQKCKTAYLQEICSTGQRLAITTKSTPRAIQTLIISNLSIIAYMIGKHFKNQLHSKRF